MLRRWLIGAFRRMGLLRDENVIADWCTSDAALQDWTATDAASMWTLTDAANDWNVGDALTDAITSAWTATDAVLNTWTVADQTRDCA